MMGLMNAKWFERSPLATVCSGNGHARNRGHHLHTHLQQRLEKGTRNLLINCAECTPGQKVLLVYETENDGYYDPALLDEVRKTAEHLGLITESYGVPLARDVTDPDDNLVAKMLEADCTVFLARLGDQIRFRTKDASKKQIISYALDREMLASPFGTIDYSAFEDLKQHINAAIASANEIHVTCPAGTDFKGRVGQNTLQVGDVTRKRFPVSVFAPVPASDFRGCVAQRGFLTGTGSHYYSPWSCEIEDTLLVNFDGSRITGFEGSAKDVAAARAHYEFVGNKYGIDTYYVHSWHAGIHPGCEYKTAAGRHFERWSGSAFGNPRLLHFHTCGAYPPGEISLNVLDPSIRLDGLTLWENGILRIDRLPESAALLEASPDFAKVFQSPAAMVGQAACGNLRYR